MIVTPTSSREGSGVSRRETATQHRPVQSRVQVSLPAIAAPTDPCESTTRPATWPGSPSSRPVMHVIRGTAVAGCCKALSADGASMTSAVGS
jgi:hypothetical protein